MYSLPYIWDVSSIRNKVRLYRRIREGMTQERLAKAVGVTRQTIIALERGKYNPSVILALKLSKALGVAVEELFTLAKE